MKKVTMVITCVKCGGTATVDSDSQFVGVNNIIKKTGWGRVVIRMPEKKIEGWVCANCAKEMKSLC